MVTSEDAVEEREGDESERRTSSMSAEDGLPDEDGEDDKDDDKDDDVDWEEAYACPLSVRFTQEKIHPFFYRRGPILNVVPKIRPMIHKVTPGAEPLGLTSADLERDVYELVPPFESITCFRKGDELWSLDNRRLYALQFAAMQWWPQRCCIKLLYSDRISRRKFKTQWRKFNTQREGRAVQVCAKFQQFESWSWFDRAVELEAYNFSQRLGYILSAFEMMPVAGALLYRTGYTGLQSRAPLLIGFVLAFAMDFFRQKVPACEQVVAMLHVKSVMEGDARPALFFGKFSSSDDEIPQVNTVIQFAALMATFLILSLPYVLGLAVEKLRSSLLSCWLGVACVLTLQLVPSLRQASALTSEYSGSAQQLTPKHRD